MNHLPLPLHKFKVIDPTWNDEFKFSDGSYFVSPTQDYDEYIIKRHETVATIPPIRVYFHVFMYSCIHLYSCLVFKVKDRFKLELQTPETTWLFGKTEKSIDNTKNAEIVTSLEVVEVVLVQCNLIDNQCH